MKLSDLKTPSETQKWLQMAAIVNQSSLPLSNIKKLALYRLINENILVFLLQYMGLMLSTLTVQSYPLWFASGTACAFIFLRGISILPGIGLGTFAAFYIANSGVGIALLASILFVLQAQFLLWLSYRYISPMLIFYQLRLFFKFIFITAVLTALTSFILMLICNNFNAERWLTWWLANFNGVLVLGFGLLTWDAFFPQIRYLKLLNKNILFLFFGSLISLMGIFLLIQQNQILTILLSAGMFIIINSIAIYYGWCGCVAAIFLLGITDYLSVLLKDDQGSMNLIQINLALVTITGIVLAIMFKIKENRHDRTPLLSRWRSL